MNLNKFLGLFISLDPHRKHFFAMNLFNNKLNQPCLQKLMNYFLSVQSNQQSVINYLVNYLQQKSTFVAKLKIISFLLAIELETNLSIAPLIIQKKLKLFNKPSKKINLDLNNQTLDLFVYVQLVIPLYNYFLKINFNMELFRVCQQKQIPYDDTFRRGSKIRFIWMFKIYNLINLIIPILNSVLVILQKNQNYNFLIQLAQKLYNNLVILNNFVIKALYQASSDNFLIMPYLDMLQFYQCMKEQFIIKQKINIIYNKYNSLKQGNFTFQKPQKFQIQNKIQKSIQLQALRVKLISTTIKNSTNDYLKIHTQYLDKRFNSEFTYQFNNILTQQNRKE